MFWRRRGLGRGRDSLFRVMDFAEPVIERAHGSYVVDDAGRRYLDFASGQLCSILGHSHPKLAAAITEQAGKSIHLGSGFVSDCLLEAAEKFSGITPKKMEKTVFLSTGTEANEFAIRCGKAYNAKPVAAGFDRGYYGSSFYTGQLSCAGNKSGLIPKVDGIVNITSPHCFRCPLGETYPSCSFSCVRESGEKLSDHSGSISSFIVEPVLSAGGMIVPPEGYFKELNKLVREHDALLIADEAQTGLGRTGRWFGFEHWDGVVPDILVVSKSAGGGYPVSGVISSKDVEEKAVKKGFTHISSHMNDPLGAKVFSTVIDVIKEEKLVENARDSGVYFKERLFKLKDSYENLLADVRGFGLMLGVEVKGDDEEDATKLAREIESHCLDKGLILGYGSFSGVFRIYPPLTVSREEIDESLLIFEDALRRVS